MNEKEYVQLSLESIVAESGMRATDYYEPGTKLKIKGERGIFVYDHASLSSNGSMSLHLVGEHGFRAVRPEQVMIMKKARKILAGKK